MLWRNEVLGQNCIWKSGNAATLIAGAHLAGAAWKIVGVGDFEGDGKGDILRRNTSSGFTNDLAQRRFHHGRQPRTSTDQGWQVAGVGDFDNDARSDILWRHTNGGNAIWRSGNSATPKTITGVAAAWQVKCVADFNGDSKTTSCSQRRRERDLAFGQRLDVESLGAAATAWSVSC